MLGNLCGLKLAVTAATRFRSCGATFAKPSPNSERRASNFVGEPKNARNQATRHLFPSVCRALNNRGATEQQGQCSCRRILRAPFQPAGPPRAHMADGRHLPGVRIDVASLEGLEGLNNLHEFSGRERPRSVDARPSNPDSVLRPHAVRTFRNVADRRPMIADRLATTRCQSFNARRRRYATVQSFFQPF